MGSRYYESCGSKDEIRPGRISADLRCALNLPQNDVPIWIYRMRAIGYPPGWLKKAVVESCDIFESDELDADAGSKKRKQPSEEISYDHSKLIEYPGFNAPMPADCYDYHYYLNMPAMLEHQQLEYAKKHMNAFKPAQIPKRIRKDPTADESSDSLNKNASSSAIDISTNDIESPDEDTSSSSDDKKTALKRNNTSSISLPEEIKLVSKGSPMPKPVARASLEKFSEGVVGELLYFENLPTSTGKFSSIRGLLNNIRRSKSETNNTSKTE